MFLKPKEKKVPSVYSKHIIYWTPGRVIENGQTFVIPLTVIFSLRAKYQTLDRARSDVPVMHILFNYFAGIPMENLAISIRSPKMELTITCVT